MLRKKTVTIIWAVPASLGPLSLRTNDFSTFTRKHNICSKPIVCVLHLLQRLRVKRENTERPKRERERERGCVVSVCAVTKIVEPNGFKVQLVYCISCYEAWRRMSVSRSMETRKFTPDASHGRNPTEKVHIPAAHHHHHHIPYNEKGNSMTSGSELVSFYSYVVYLYSAPSNPKDLDVASWWLKKR